MSGVKKFLTKTERFITAVDQKSLWWTGFLLAAVFFYPIAVLGKGAVFPYHDQLDESLMLYVLKARHLFEGVNVFPEMMGGVVADGVTVSAPLFVLLYYFFPTYMAYLIQYAVVALTGFFGMYFCVKELTGSSILSVAMAGCFFMLPLYPIYGLSSWGIPMVLYAFIKLYKKERAALQFVLLAYFANASYLMYTGYTILVIGAAAVLWLIIRKKSVKWITAGLTELFLIYAWYNRSMIKEFFFGAGGYISHRIEMVNPSSPFWKTAWDMFLNSGMGAPSYHKYLILPIIILLLAEGIFYKRYDGKEKRKYLFALGGMLFLIGTAVFAGFCKTPFVTDFKNHTAGVLHSFQMDRFYWLYPALWYIEFGVVFSVWWNGRAAVKEASDAVKPWNNRTGKLLVFLFLLFPTIHEIAYESVFYMNVNQKNNGSEITGYISWESYYSEELMAEIEDAIGRDMSTYRVAHLGICPSPAIQHGFYTVDGYSNNYSLDYKHKFRKVIAEELDKVPETKVYFDTWGSRCYLFNSATGNAWMLGKKDKIVYENLQFDMEALKELGCEYLFSCGKILNAEELGLKFMGYYETEVSYWGIWLYQV